MSAADQPQQTDAGVDAVVEAMHAEHLREFPWLAGDQFTDKVEAAECGICQRWARYAAAVFADVIHRDGPDADPIRARLGLTVETCNCARPEHTRRVVGEWEKP